MMRPLASNIPPQNTPEAIQQLWQKMVNAEDQLFLLGDLTNSAKSTKGIMNLIPIMARAAFKYDGSILLNDNNDLLSVNEPFVNHNKLGRLQGGLAADQYYHLDATDYASVSGDAFVRRDGTLAMTANWNLGTFSVGMGTTDYLCDDLGAAAAYATKLSVSGETWLLGGGSHPILILDQGGSDIGSVFELRNSYNFENNSVLSTMWFTGVDYADSQLKRWGEIEVKILSNVDYYGAMYFRTRRAVGAPVTWLYHYKDGSAEKSVFNYDVNIVGETTLKSSLSGIATLASGLVATTPDNHVAWDSAASASHAKQHNLLTVADHGDVATYLNQALLTSSTPTLAGLGIGRAPTTLLDVYGSYPILKIEDTHGDGDGAGLHLRSGTYDCYIRNKPSAGLCFSTESLTDALVITQAGNISIGTVSQLSKKLELHQASNDVDAYLCVWSATASHSPCIAGLHSKSATPGTLATTDTDTGCLLLAGQAVNAAGTPARVNIAYMKIVQDGAAGANYNPGRFEFYTGTNAAQPLLRMSIKSSGSVGIGSADPKTFFHIKGAHVPFYGQLTLEDATGNGIYFRSGVANDATEMMGYIYCSTTVLTINNYSGGAYGAISLNPNGGEVVVNDGGSATADFRCEGDTITNLLLVDASADTVNVNGPLVVTGDANLHSTVEHYTQAEEWDSVNNSTWIDVLTPGAYESGEIQILAQFVNGGTIYNQSRVLRYTAIAGAAVVKMTAIYDDGDSVGVIETQVASGKIQIRTTAATGSAGVAAWIHKRRFIANI